MRIQSIVQEACPVCGKETTLAVVEPHLTHPEMELHIYISMCGLRTGQNQVHSAAAGVDCAERHNSVLRPHRDLSNLGLHCNAEQRGKHATRWRCEPELSRHVKLEVT